VTFSKLGTDIQTGHIVELPQASRRQGLYIIGANGTGKTGLIENLILQDIDQGLGVGLLDPHGDLTNALLAKMTKRVEDVILLDITDKDYPFGLNLFECSDPTDSVAVQKIVDLVMHIFEKLYDVSRQTPRMAQFLRNCTHTLVANPGYTMAEIPLLLQDGECRKKLVAQVTDPQVRLFWKTYDALKPSEQFDRAESTINKMDELLQPLPRNIVGQAKTTVKIQQVMDERKILLVKLSAQLDQVTSLIGSVIIALFLNAVYSRASLPVNKRKQFNLYADEFQRFATEDFATLLTEARKFGIATTIAHQARYQPGMTDGIRAVSLQAANFVVFRVTSLDADEIAGSFDTTPPPPKQEEATRRAIQTPVMEPIQFMLQKGVHPHPEVRNFINVYGQEIVKGAKQEEEAEREYRHALDAAIRDSPVGFGYNHWIFRYDPPTTSYRPILESLNQLLYQAMVVGKQGGNTDTIPITPEFIGYWIETLPTVPDEVKQHSRLEQQYQRQYIDPAQLRQLQVADLKRREHELQKKLALPQLSPRQSELRLAEAKYTHAIENLRLALRRAFIAQVEEVTKLCVIIQKGNGYYRPQVRSLPDAKVIYELNYVYEYRESEKYRGFQKIFINDLRCDRMAGRFRSLEEAIAYHARALQFLWFRAEPTLRDRNWWQHKRSVVEFWDDPTKKGNQLKMLELDTWVPKLGIARTWYTEAMLDTMVESTLQAVTDLWTGGRMSRPEDNEDLTRFLPASLGGNDFDYREFWLRCRTPVYERLKEQGIEQGKAVQEAYDARKELTNLRLEIDGEVSQKTARLEHELRMVAELQTYKLQYDTFVADFTNQLRKVMQVLGVDRIEEDSGQQEIVYRPGPVRPFQDVKNDIANQLSGLPQFTARVKIGENAPQNPGKKCLSCGQQSNSGAKFCQGCGTQLPASNEYTIITLKPAGGIGKAAFDQRIAYIQARNRDPRYGGYCRPRKEVEAEIINRQTVCSGGAAPAQPQRPAQQPHPQRFARQVLVQGKCPHCGFSNNPQGAKFCNQCGTKL
jgi:hypothetical protein